MRVESQCLNVSVCIVSAKAVEPRDHFVVIRPPTPNGGIFVKKITRLTVGALSIFEQLHKLFN